MNCLLVLNWGLYPGLSCLFFIWSSFTSYLRFHLLVSIHSIQGIIYLPECLFHFLRGDILIGNRSGITQFLLGEGLGVLPYLLKLFRDSGYVGMYRFAPQTNV